MKKRLEYFLRITLVLFAVIVFLQIFPNTLVGQEVDLLISPGKLSQIHDHLSGIKNCSNCHISGEKTVDPKCLDCHKELSQRIKLEKGFHSDKKDKCAGCHPDHLGPKFSLIEWEPEKFIHEDSGYALTGLHTKIQNCEKCHNSENAPPTKTSRSFLIKDNRCVSCHKDVHQVSLGKNCESCHSLQVSFKEVSYDHNRSAFALKGAHLKVSCASCHKQKKWKGLDYGRCMDCHKDPHTPSLGSTCLSCHHESSWQVGIFNHDQTRYPLQGKHINLECNQCHKSSTLTKIPYTECRDCHSRDPHAGQFSEDCGICHDVKNFKNVRLDHQKTRYPLTGKHVQIVCSKCHFASQSGGSVLYKPIQTGCQDCHNDIHLKQFKISCKECHSTSSFKGDALLFDHSIDSTYRLEGSHRSLECQKCHIEETADFSGETGKAVRYRPIVSECVTCHSDYHLGQLGTNCSACHDLVHFKPATAFQHEKSKYSPSTFHDSVTCVKCHPLTKAVVNGSEVLTAKYKPLGIECLDCHRETKHNKTAFPLKGKHAIISCSSCHTSKTPNTKTQRKPGLDTPECRQCHTYRHPGDYLQCQKCHKAESWRIDIWQN